MLRITTSFEDDTSVTLRLDGSLVGVTEPDLESLCTGYREAGKKAISLDFSGVCFIDGHNLRMLEKIKDGGVKLINGSPFIEALLSGLKP